MLDQYAAAHLAARTTSLVANSARPDAPVVAPRESVRLETARARLAAQLHRIATAVEPRHERTLAGASPVCR